VTAQPIRVPRDVHLGKIGQHLFPLVVLSMRTLCVLLLAAFPAFAAELKPIEIPLWPKEAPGEKIELPEEGFQPAKAGENPPLKRLSNVSKPTITIYRPKAELDNGAAVVVAPGGGYTILAWEHEGTQVAEWLNSLGVTAVLLKYRVPKRADNSLAAAQDAQRAIRLVRSKAKEWKIDENRIGMLGFSAGGHLTAWTSTNYDKRSYEPVDDADKLSCKPDFSVLIYPGGLLEKDGTMKPEIKITKDTPASFIAVAYDDKGCFDSLSLVKALKANNVSAEMHMYSSGGHGFGMKPSEKPFATWPKSCGDWMKVQGYLNAKK
jgi:acetyl esterase/lipase